MKWEYKIKHSSEIPGYEINGWDIKAGEVWLCSLGAKGWELINTTFNDAGKPSAFFFKRPVRE